MVLQKEGTDVITGLPFYDSFVKTVEEVLNHRSADAKYALVSTDISNFKYINRIYGYDKANELLKSLVNILKSDEAGNLCSCRTHSDHIISFFKYTGEKADFEEWVEHYSNEFVKRNARKYPSVTLHLNNGLMFLEGENEDLYYSIDKANVARRVSKGNYCVTSVLYSDDMLVRQEEDAKIISIFDNAVKNGDIRIFFQPKIDVPGHKIKGAEVLSRIIDRNGKMMYPDSYIFVLENSGKIVELDWFVIKQTFSAIRKWIDNGWNAVPVSINLSRMHFYENNISERLYKEFLKYKIPIEYIEFELTESLFFAEADLIISEITKLRQYGFKVSMDDFGVGYSTLNSLGTLPVDVIKFDKGFINNSINSDAGYQILLSLIQVFKRINYDVICEGVETKSQEKLIFECGCDTVQGFLYDKPLEIEVFERKYIM